MLCALLGEFIGCGNCKIIARILFDKERLMGEILFIYRPFGLKSRKTISDSIFCFKHAEKSEHNVYFYDYTHNRNTWKRLSKHKFDVVIYHYTFMTLRSDPNIWIEAQERLKTIRVKEGAVIIQDEYIYSKYT